MLVRVGYKDDGDEFGDGYPNLFALFIPKLYPVAAIAAFKC